MTAFQSISANKVVARALQYVGEGYYKLGGGSRPTSASPFDPEGNQFPGFCDCSGFSSWCMEYRRGPWNTDAVVADARVKRSRFRLVKRDEVVIPSDLVVYPGPDKDHDGERDSPGHIGVVVAVGPDFERGKNGWWEHLEIAHCTPRNQLKVGAIKHSDASLWAGRGYIIRALHVAP